MRRTKVWGRPLFTIIPRSIANLLDESINNKDKPKYIEVVTNKTDPIPNVYGINLSVFEAESLAPS
jgi:hypothetical protein